MFATVCGPTDPARHRSCAILFGLLILLASTARAAKHPLDPLTGEEITTTVEVLKAAGELTDSSEFILIALLEPPKAEVLSYKPGQPFSREASVIVHDRATRRSFTAVVNLNEKSLASWKELRGVQPALVGEEDLKIMARALRADPKWQDALRRRGITDSGAVELDYLVVGYYGVPDEQDGRLANAIPYYKGKATNLYARPIGGLRAVVDLDTGKVVKVVDSGVVPVPKAAADLDMKSIGPQRTPPKPLLITQPEGASFTVDDNEVHWQNWVFRFSLQPREGLVLQTVGYEDGGKLRSILYRANVSEMFIPYADQGPQWYFRNIFDEGEYGLGWETASLAPLMDAPANAQFFDATYADEHGKPTVIPRAVALYERDGGILWKHYDFVTQTNESRRARELVLTSVATVGNYDYGFNWIFHQDGTLEMEVLLTGILEAEDVRDTSMGDYTRSQQSHLVAPNVAAVHHQHFLNFRLDLDVDGAGGNTVVETNTQGIPMGPGNPYGDEFVTKETVLGTEQEAIRQVSMDSSRTWMVINTGAQNALGSAVGYALLPGENAIPYNAPDSFTRKRAGFTSAPFWVTPYNPAEMYAAGDYPNQNKGREGLPKWTAENRSIENQDVVVWYTVGITHIPHPEQWPVMTVHKAGFKLVPVGFFSRNPALDVPVSK